MKQWFGQKQAVHSGATVYRLAKRLFRTCGRAQRKIIRAMILRIDLWE